nr:MAG TPA: hypothetical protein [Bacteriophage sp.]
MSFKYIIAFEYTNGDFLVSKYFLCRDLEEVKLKLNGLKKWCTDYRELKFVRVFSLNASIKEFDLG